MSIEDAGETIAGDEIVYRRVPANPNYYVPDSDRPVQWIAYKPSSQDSSGISVWRAKHVDPEDVAQTGRVGKAYFVVPLNVAELRGMGTDVVSSPKEGGPGHATVTGLSWERYTGTEKEAVMELAMRISQEASRDVLGPFEA